MSAKVFCDGCGGEVDTPELTITRRAMSAGYGMPSGTSHLCTECGRIAFSVLPLRVHPGAVRKPPSLCRHPHHSRPATREEREQDHAKRAAAIDKAAKDGVLSGVVLSKARADLETFTGYTRCTL